MENNLFSRNSLYINSKEQETIANCKILFAGAGIGSNIAECALRLGFQNIKFIDNDSVEYSNLNRQNYTGFDIGKSKAEMLYNRLISINPNANISYENLYLDENNIENQINRYEPHFTINALDFTSNAPFLFDECCIHNNIPILHPFNFGWAGLVTVVKNTDLRIIQKEYTNFELAFANYIIKIQESKNIDMTWLKNILSNYIEDNKIDFYPQLSIGSWYTAGMCSDILFRLATNKDISFFPNLYYLSTY